MVDIEHEALSYKRKRSLGGLKYTAVLKKKGFKAINFLKGAFKEKQFFILLRVFLRSMRLGWCIPFLTICRKIPFWNRFVFSQLMKWGKAICEITKVKLHVINSENVSKDKTYLFASNHLSLMDIPVLCATIPVKNKFIANRELASFFITNILIKFGDSLLVNKGEGKGQLKALKDIRKSLLRRDNLIIFPESNMSYNGKIQEFQRGGLSAAVFAKVHIMPVYIKGTREVYTPGAFSFKLNQDVYVLFGEAIDCGNLKSEDKKNIDAIVYKKLQKLSSNITQKIQK